MSISPPEKRMRGNSSGILAIAVSQIKRHRESPPISMRLLWLPFITSSILVPRLEPVRSGNGLMVDGRPA